jgi:hypothetical protein
VRYLRGVGLAVCLLVWAPAAAAQTGPDCDPATTASVTVTAEESDIDKPPVATHEIVVTADFSQYVAKVVITPPPGVQVTGRGTGGFNVAVIAPNATSLPVTVSWRQARDPEGPPDDADSPSTSCAASREVTLALRAARPSHAVKPRLWRQLGQSGFTDVAIVPALKQPDLSPLEISSKTTSRVAFPPANARARTMSVPMRTADQVRYNTRLPNPAYMTVPQACRFYYVTCATPFATGGVFTQVARLLIDDRALRRGIEKGDVNGSLVLLARTQPAKEAARYGIMVEARPGGVRLGQPRPFGYDVQVRQSGRLIARVRKAGRCVERRLPQGLVTQCRIARSSNLLR